ncbi:MAG: hypothetical protein MJ113_00020 [Lachnospiraceae bacterium]|nr:hypothetical protein [Lachnospiraceae bacterium]
MKKTGIGSMRAKWKEEMKKMKMRTFVCLTIAGMINAFGVTVFFVSSEVI